VLFALLANEALAGKNAEQLQERSPPVIISENNKTPQISMGKISFPF